MDHGDLLSKISMYLITSRQQPDKTIDRIGHDLSHDFSHGIYPTWAFFQDRMGL